MGRRSRSNWTLDDADEADEDTLNRILWFSSARGDRGALSAGVRGSSSESLA